MNWNKNDFINIYNHFTTKDKKLCIFLFENYKVKALFTFFHESK